MGSAPRGVWSSRCHRPARFVPGLAQGLEDVVGQPMIEGVPR